MSAIAAQLVRDAAKGKVNESSLASVLVVPRRGAVPVAGALIEMKLLYIVAANSPQRSAAIAKQALPERTKRQSRNPGCAGGCGSGCQL